jgi:hypothetical protein
LREEGFPDEVLSAVDCLTRREGESYQEFVERVRTNPVARQVKVADLEDNMNIRRMNRLGAKELERLEKYHKAWLVLTDAGDGRVRANQDEQPSSASLLTQPA